MALIFNTSKKYIQENKLPSTPHWQLSNTISERTSTQFLMCLSKDSPCIYQKICICGHLFLSKLGNKSHSMLQLNLRAILHTSTYRYVSFFLMVAQYSMVYPASTPLMNIDASSLWLQEQYCRNQLCTYVSYM